MSCDSPNLQKHRATGTLAARVSRRNDYCPNRETWAISSKFAYPSLSDELVDSYSSERLRFARKGIGGALMDRRTFIHASAAGALSGGLVRSDPVRADDTPGFASPKEAVKAPRENILYVTCTYANTRIDQPDYLAVVDADPASASYSKVIGRVSMPKVGDELHHFGWNICSSCHGRPGDRRYLIVPGLKSSRIHVIDAKDPAAPKMHKVIEPEAVKKAGLSAPHTVHCLPSGEVMLSMLGDADVGNAPGGFLLLDDRFRRQSGVGEADSKGVKFHYDFWYQPRHNMLVSTEWAAPNTYLSGFDPKDVAAGKYGSRLCLWDWTQKKLTRTIDLGERGQIPLEVRFFHDPDAANGYVGAALSSAVWRVFKAKGRDQWDADPVIQVDPVKAGGNDVPGLITDILVSMDDRFLYFSNWLHGDIRQYDLSNPIRTKIGRPTLPRRGDREGEGVPREKTRRRAADAATVPRRETPLRNQHPP